MSTTSPPRLDLAAAVVRHRRWIALAWLLAAVALLPAARRSAQTLDVAAQVHGSESAAVEAALAERFASPFAHWAVLVVSGIPAPDAPVGRAALRDIRDELAGAPGVARTLSYLDTPDTLFLGHRGAGSFLLVGLDPGDGPADALVPGLRSATRALTERLRAEHPGFALRWTGEVALNYDLRTTSAEEAQGAERRVLPLTLALLLLAFGAIAASLLPLAVGLLAISLALGAAVLLTSYWPLSILLENIITMLGLALGVDYSLLIVSRFREELAAGRTPDEAAAEATRHAGHTVALSGGAVAIGFAALLLVPLNELQSVGVGGLLVTGVSVLLATTLLPGLLAWLGRRVDMGRVVRLRSGSGGDRWRAWGRWVARRPVRVLVVTGLPLLLLSLQALRIRTDLPRGDWLPPEMESARALAELERMGRGGVVHSLRIVVDFPEGTNALKPGGWAAVRHLGEHIGADPRVARVRSLPELAGGRAPTPMLLSSIPADVLHSFVSRDGRSAVVEVMPRDGVGLHELGELVQQLRATDPAVLTGLGGTRLAIGGMPAFNVDYREVIAGRFFGIVGLVIGATLVALLIGFRSLLIPVKALLLNLISVTGAFGAVVLVFQDGYGAGLLGLSAPVGSVFPAIPIVVFCIVFGLSMDYEVFLVSRVAEARRAGMGEEEAIAEGLARTGGVITSAAAVMIVVFAAFTLGDFIFIQMLGFALAVAVLIDATVVRIAVGPALLRLAGRWNWWPGPMSPASQSRAGVSPARPAPAPAAAGD